MFIAILSTIISSFADVFWKKTMAYNVRPFAHSVASLPVVFILCIYFFSTGFSLSTAEFITAWAVFLILLLDVVKEPILQQVYKEEKISVLMPYFNLNKVFVIISSFFLFQDVSNISFCITIFTALVIMLASIDIKNKKLPRNFWKIIFIEANRTIGTLLGGWVILNYSETMYFVLYALFWAVIYFSLAAKTKQISDLKTVPRIYWKLRPIGSLGWLSWFLSLVVIKNLGLSIGILLWFLWIGITLFVSFIFLKDKPSRKDIILTIIVAILIAIWFYFK